MCWGICEYRSGFEGIRGIIYRVYVMGGRYLGVWFRLDCYFVVFCRRVSLWEMLGVVFFRLFVYEDRGCVSF